MDFLKRGLIAYVGITAALWLMSFAMIDNGAAWPRNPAWQLIVGLRSLFTWAGIVTVGFFAVLSVLTLIGESQQRRHEEAERLRHGEIDRRRSEDAQRQRESDEAERRRQETRERKRAKEEREYCEFKERQQKRTRSAETATQDALDDF
ncbi:MAG: hypothetical protein JNJ49_09205 [Bdellovibrionaceae bacterium]|nr:hypothetical protein [Pseudobdellovibrionaceae bacterium]